MVSNNCLSMCDVAAEETVSVNTLFGYVANENSASKQPALLVSTSVQTADEPPFNVDRFSLDDAGIHYYTEFETNNKFFFILSTHGIHCRVTPSNVTYFTLDCYVGAAALLLSFWYKTTL